MDYEDSGFSGDFTIDNSINFAGALGLRLNDMMRAEVELSYRNADLDSVSVNGIGIPSVGGDLKTFTALVNGYYDLGQVMISMTKHRCLADTAISVLPILTLTASTPNMTPMNSASVSGMGFRFFKHSPELSYGSGVYLVHHYVSLYHHRPIGNFILKILI